MYRPAALTRFPTHWCARNASRNRIVFASARKRSLASLRAGPGGHPSCQPCRRRNTGLSCRLLLRLAHHSATLSVSAAKQNRFLFPLHRSIPASLDLSQMCQGPVMTHLRQIKRGRVARLWHSQVAVRWYRMQFRLVDRYCQQVHRPIRRWRRSGCPHGRFPQLPWWQAFLWRWLVITGFAPDTRR